MLAACLQRYQIFQKMNVTSLEHHFCSMLKWKLLVSSGDLSFACGFQTLRASSKAESVELRV